VSDQELFQARLQVVFRDARLLEQALTHRSFVNEVVEAGWPDNQRLEFLGDAILGFLVGEWLYSRYPDAREGELTSLRAHVVRTDGLAACAREIELGTVLRLGKGEAASGGASRTANLCAAFEALVGAIYLDQGLEVVRAWVRATLERHAADIDAQRANKDAKSELQEYAQRVFHLTPSYRIAREDGPDHARTFTAEALVGTAVWGQGCGNSKQAAEQAAAENALVAHPDDAPRMDQPCA
jgi:ribonuclease-3